MYMMPIYLLYFQIHGYNYTQSSVDSTGETQKLQHEMAALAVLAQRGAHVWRLIC